jgi:hypothetical protein
VLRKVLGLTRDEVIGRRKKRQHKKELHNVYPSEDTVWVTKSRRMRWAGPVARIEDRRVKRPLKTRGWN